MTYTLTRGTPFVVESRRFFRTMKAAREAAEADYKFALGGQGRLVWKREPDDMEAMVAHVLTENAPRITRTQTRYTIRPLKVEG
jgi:hypothetical protein